MTQLTIWGGAGEHGRSSYLLQHGEQALLLDCGGKKERGGQYPLIDEEVLPHLKAVFLSHAHEDHSMAIPLLYKHGFKGKVWTTRTTAQQLPVYFQAWSHYAYSQSINLPYNDQHIEAIDYVFLEDRSVPGVWGEVFPGLRMKWGRSGHLPGSVWFALDWADKLIYFSGDYTEESSLLAVDRPVHLLGPQQTYVDLAIIDAAYGADPDSQAIGLEELERVTRETLRKNGTVLYPVPTYGRGQELLVWANEVFPEAALIVEQVLMEQLHQLATMPDWLHDNALARIEVMLACGRLNIVADTEAREHALSRTEGAIIFTDDGMMQSKTAQWYYKRLASSTKNAVILTGHLAAGSYGELLLGTNSTQVHHVRYKVHQGLPDVRNMLEWVPSKATVLVHASKTETDLLLKALPHEDHHTLHSLCSGEILTF
ncbi:putative metal-dependent RNase [Paenibacillus sp. DS2015]|uniref:MBL fold metallo-hydrolase n=1 Tax=Paenibacillus sp. DS2015 TaxID=3373917 RepID=UPI003D22A17B